MLPWLRERARSDTTILDTIRKEVNCRRLCHVTARESIGPYLRCAHAWMDGFVPGTANCLLSHPTFSTDRFYDLVYVTRFADEGFAQYNTDE